MHTSDTGASPAATNIQVTYIEHPHALIKVRTPDASIAVAQNAAFVLAGLLIQTAEQAATDQPRTLEAI